MLKLNYIVLIRICFEDSYILRTGPLSSKLIFYILEKFSLITFYLANWIRYFKIDIKDFVSHKIKSKLMIKNRSGYKILRTA